MCISLTQRRPLATIVLSDERDWVSGSLGDVVATHFRINSTQVMLKA